MLMKKIGALISTIFAFILVLFFCANPTKADVDYNISNLKITAQVNTDGSLTMKRQVSYDFDSSAHGVYYRQNLAKNQDLVEPSVSIKTNNGPQVKIKQDSGSNNSYQLSHDNNGYRFKIYHKIAADHRLIVTYQYRITNAIINWQDTAELNFKIIGNNWDSDLEHVEAIVNFANSTQIPDLKAWAHGPLTGNIKVNHKLGQVILTQNDLAGDVGIELHAIFPNSLTVQNKNTRSEKRRKQIISQEIKLANEANRKRRARKITGIAYTAVSTLIAAITAIFSIIKYWKSKKNQVTLISRKASVHNFEIPPVDAVTAKILDSGQKPNAQSFSAYLIQLAGKGNIKIDKTNKRNNFEIQLLKPEILETDPILNQLFNKVGDGTKFTTKQLRKAKLADEFIAWQERKYKKVSTEGLFDKAKLERYTSTSMGLLATNFIILFLLIISFIFSFQVLFVLVIIGLINLYFSSKYKKITNYYTEHGIETTNQVRGFIKMLDDIGKFQTKDIGELIFWEDVMPYAVAFGLAKKVIAQLKIDFDNETLAPMFLYYPILQYDTDFTAFDNSINTALYNSIGANSSLSGGSGGFSGGSSGGFGGGSGGGAF